MKPMANEQVKCLQEIHKNIDHLSSQYFAFLVSIKGETSPRLVAVEAMNSKQATTIVYLATEHLDWESIQEIDFKFIFRGLSYGVAELTPF